MAGYKGLTTEEARKNNEKYGLNKLTPPKKKSLWRLYLEKYNDPIIKILMLAAVLSIITGLFHGEAIEGIGILAAVLLATTMAFANEYRAGKEFDVLNQVNDDVPYKTIRDGGYTPVGKQYITVDDIVMLETGDEVPADAYVLEATGFEVDESSLTGESMPAEKRPYTEGETSEEPYPDFKVFKGTLVRSGHAIIRVHAVGDNAEMGQTARLASEERSEKTPLNRQLEGLSKVIGRVGFIVAGALFAVLVARAFMTGQMSRELETLDNLQVLISIFMIAVTIIVVSVPEGLAMSVTLSLAYSMRKMMAANTLVRHMDACETIGAATVICTDKTGTLTMNKMTVAAAYFNEEEKNQWLINLSFAVNSSANLGHNDKGELQVLGNPTEGALLLYLKDHDINYEEYRKSFKIAEQLPFATEYKYMATFGTGSKGEMLLMIKGSPESVLDKCSSYGNKSRDEWLRQIYAEQGKARRTLGFAIHRDFKSGADLKDLSGLEWLGFVAIADPVRPEVKGAMDDCRTAGIGVKMLTGDSLETASEIGREIGLLSEDQSRGELIITGAQFEAMSDEEVDASVGRLAVMARARPQDKLRLVKALQKRHEVVAVTGDGTNDGPALNHANVGLSMGITGTAVAKEASDIVLLDDSFKSIVNAVMWGRSLYANIQRFLLFQLTINVSALGIALAGPFIGIDLPITVMQMLWINLIMDTFAALALATETAERSILKNKPRNAKAFIVTPVMSRTIFGTAALFIAFFIGFLIYMRDDMNNLYYSTVFFNLFVMLQFWNLFNARFFGKKVTLRGFFGNRSFILICLLILLGQFAIVQWGGSFFRTTPLDLRTWLLIIGGTSVIFWLNLIFRLIRRAAGALGR
jgi:Ca2+-transporting ATPase